MTRFVFLDTETTGLNPHLGGHRIIDLACVEYRDGKSTGNVFNNKINPEGKKSTKGAFNTHKISDEELKAAPTFKEVSEDFINFITGSHLVIYNAKFDTQFLNSELNRINYPNLINEICSEVTCAMELAKQKFKLDKFISQDNACRRYGIDISQRIVHAALIDANLCAELFFKLVDDTAIPLQRTPQTKKHREPKLLTIPRAYKCAVDEQYIQLNFCKNSECENFGVPAKNPAKYENGKPKKGLRGEYKLTTRKRGENEYLLTCKLCGKSSVMINNQSLGKEIERLSSVGKYVEPSCNNTGDKNTPFGERKYYIPLSAEERRGTAIVKGRCENVGKGVFSYPELYTMSGKTRKNEVVIKEVRKPLNEGGKPVFQQTEELRLGSKRVKCETCNSRFYIKLDPQQRHYMRDRNEALFLNLMNKGIINREEDKLDITAKAIYHKIDFFYEQALAFDAYHSQKMDMAVIGKTLNLSTDRLHHSSNWTNHNEPRPTPLMVTSTVDNDTGYVFASTLNFDFESDSENIKREHKDKKENEKDSYYRRYAQYILNDIDVKELVEDTNANVPMQIPSKGLLVNQTYSMLSHFALLKEILTFATQINLYADNDSGFKTSICGIFKDWLEKGKLNAFQVYTERSGNNQLLDKSTSEQIKQRDIELQKEYPELSADERLKLLWKQQYDNRVTMEGSKSEWIVSPNMRSRFSGFHSLGNIQAIDSNYATELLDSASLHGVDNWFQILRRHINYYERPVTSGTNSKRWNVYAGYNPKWMMKLMEIKRVYHNYCSTNADTIKKDFKGKINKPTPTSPAMRLSLARKVYKAHDILSFSYDYEMLKNAGKDERKRGLPDYVRAEFRKLKNKKLKNSS